MTVPNSEARTVFFGRAKQAEELNGTIHPLLVKAEASALAGEHASAATSYAEAWRLLAGAKGGVKAVGHEHAFWILMNCVNSEWLAGDFDGAMSAADVAHRNLRGKSFGPVGNPFFHLRLGQSLWALAEADGEDPAIAGLDNLARALICGGIEIYSGEPAHFLKAVTTALDPPEGFTTWDASRGKYPGACTDLLSGAVGHVRLLLTEKFEKAPPYVS
jgi:hypothetical protein